MPGNVHDSEVINVGIKPYRQCAAGYVNGVYVSIPKVEELILSIRSRFRFRNKGFRISMLEVMVGWWKNQTVNYRSSIIYYSCKQVGSFV